MNPKILICILLLLGLASSCHRNTQNQVNKLPLNEEQLVKVLVDIHIAEVAAHKLVGPQRDSIGQVYYRQIFAIHQVDSAQFFKSLSMLQKDPKHMRAIYDRVIEQIGKLEATKKQQRKTTK